jgi:hypothetical protein
MRKISAKMVPRILTDDQKQHRLRISSDLLHDAEVCEKAITSKESWSGNKRPEHAVEMELTSVEKKMHLSLPCLCVSSITR